MTEIPRSSTMIDTDGQQSLTAYPKKKELMKHPGEPWLDNEAVCCHCSKVFPSMGSLRSHFSHCKLRFLNRYYKCEGYLFCIQINPLKKRRAAIQKLVTELKDPKILLGAVSLMINLGIVRNYSALQLEDSQDLIERPNGRILYSDLKRTMSPRELALLEAQVIQLNNEKLELMAAHKSAMGISEAHRNKIGEIMK